jgi:hypothetical protein
VLGLLGDENCNVRSSVHETVSELVKYGMFQEQHDMLRLMMPSEDIRQHVSAHGVETVLGLLGDHDLGVQSSVLNTLSELIKYGMF